MYIFLGLAVFSILCYAINRKAEQFSALDSLSTFGMAIGTIAFIVLMALIPLNHISNISKIQKFKECRRTVKVARKADRSKMERAALLNKVIEYNTWLRAQQYWNNNTFDLWISDRVEIIEPIK